MQKPFLSIGLIFKNEIRCLERCMKSLRPLRDAIPCELVMADTGSDDGSREIAEKYADILIDFPWTNDFAAARNAVMDRCSGQWYFSIDADEWLDEDITELAGFLRRPDRKWSFCFVMIRNYTNEALENYGDFLALRLVRLSKKVRFTGTIHEHWEYYNAEAVELRETLLHHDGYVGLSTEKGRAKRERNMALLREKLKENPDDVRTLMQCVESSVGTPEQEGFIRRAVESVRKRRPGWEQLGGAILRSAVSFAQKSRLKEEEKEWLALARERFPSSLFTTLDIQYGVFSRLAWDENSAEAIAAGEMYLKALNDYRSGKTDTFALRRSSLFSASVLREYALRFKMSELYLDEKQFEDAEEVLKAIDIGQLTAAKAGAYLGSLMNLHAQTPADQSRAAAEVWDYFYSEHPDRECQKELYRIAAQSFTREHRQAEEEKGFRHAYTVYLSLADKYEIGAAAAILEAEGPDAIRENLLRIENWDLCPMQALAHALGHGIAFPLPERPLYLEEADSLAARLAGDREIFFRLVPDLAAGGSGGDVQGTNWQRSLISAAVRAFDWDGEEADEALGRTVARSFAQIEAVFLPLCYTPDAFESGGLFLLPPMHRFGWHCVQAFEALDSGDPRGYVRCLREGLSVYQEMKPMVEFLLKHTPEIQPPKPSGELLALAEQVRTMLLAYPVDDPAVAALKSSPVYQRVAHLIEGPDLVMAGGLAQ